MSYEELETQLASIADLEHGIAMLLWDQQVLMPPGGAAARADALATLEQAVHERTAAKELVDLIEDARASDLDGWEAANVEEIHRCWV